MLVRLMLGYLVGVFLATSLVFAVYPTDGIAVILSWPIAYWLGWVSGLVSRRSSVIVAGLSAATGASAPVLVVASVSLHEYMLLYGGPYVVFALLGGLTASLAWDEINGAGL